MREIRSSPEVPVPKCRRSLREGKSEERENYSVNNNSQSLHMEKKRLRQRNTSNTSNLSETEELLDQSASHDTQLTESSSEEEEQFSHRSQNRSKTISPERDVSKKPKRKQHIVPPESEQNTNSYSYIFFFVILVAIVLWVLPSIVSKNGVQTQVISLVKPIDQKQLLFESIKSIQTTFNNQESDIWNDISSAINEVMSKTPKKPSIILLFAKETTTMDCLATKLANASSIILQGDSYLTYNPKDFGNDAGEIITILNMQSPKKKKVVMIRDILNINAEAIKALHNLCDRINPLIAEAIYILTMQTNNYHSAQKKLKFVESQIYNKLSESIDEDVLMALVTRITDGAIISVQPEPQLKYC